MVLYQIGWAERVLWDIDPELIVSPKRMNLL
jgi:hypothetical protein